MSTQESDMRQTNNWKFENKYLKIKLEKNMLKWIFIFMFTFFDVFSSCYSHRRTKLWDINANSSTINVFIFFQMIHLNINIPDFSPEFNLLETIEMYILCTIDQKCKCGRIEKSQLHSARVHQERSANSAVEHSKQSDFCVHMTSFGILHC